MRFATRQEAIRFYVTLETARRVVQGDTYAFVDGSYVQTYKGRDWFMREVHRELRDLQGTVNPLDVLGKNIAKRYKLICFDEFHVADITDAMILHRLLDSLFQNGVGFVTTSNFMPDGLYPDGLHRDRILPAIDLLNRQLEVINVDNGTDYRRRTLEQVKLYHCPLGDVASEFPDVCEAETRIFSELTGVHVTRLATIAGGSPVCTTLVPHTRREVG